MTEPGQTWRHLKRGAVGFAFVGIGILSTLLVGAGKDLGLGDLLAVCVGLVAGVGLFMSVAGKWHTRISGQLGIPVLLIAGLASILRFAPTSIQLGVLSLVIGFAGAVTYVVVREAPPPNP